MQYCIDRGHHYKFNNIKVYFGICAQIIEALIFLPRAFTGPGILCFIGCASLTLCELQTQMLFFCHPRDGGIEMISSLGCLGLTVVPFSLLMFLTCFFIGGI